MWRVPGLADSDVVVTNMRGAHAATIAEHAFAMLLTHTPRPARASSSASATTSGAGSESR